MIKLIFNPSSFPRTITRSEWKDIWRWKRDTEKRLKAHMDAQMQDFYTYGTTWSPNARDDFIQKLTNPPIMMHPRQRI